MKRTANQERARSLTEKNEAKKSYEYEMGSDTIKSLRKARENWRKPSQTRLNHPGNAAC